MLNVSVLGMLLIALSSCGAAAETASTINLSSATPLDPGYQSEFSGCDRSDRFRGYQFPIRNRRGKIAWYPCSSDKNRVAAMLKFAAAEGLPGAIYISSKMGLDLDGSWIACKSAGLTDQCPTSLMLPRSAQTPCVVTKFGGASFGPDQCVPVDADRIAYVVIPMAGPRGAPATEFSKRTGIHIGDYGVVLQGPATVPVIVADGGPFNKFGEGSMALQRKLGIEFCVGRDEAGKCVRARSGRSIPGGVVTIIFPGTADPRKGLALETLQDTIDATSRKYFSRFLERYGS